MEKKEANDFLLQVSKVLEILSFTKSSTSFDLHETPN